MTAGVAAQAVDGASLQTGMIDAASEPVQRILGAAECCFCGAGYAAASLREIAQLAEVSKSLLHYHFQSKEHLFLEVLVRIHNRLAERIVEAVREEATPLARAEIALDTLFEGIRENPDFQAQARVWARSLSNASLEAHASRMREHLRGVIIATLDEIVGEARERLPFPLEAVADLLWASLTGLGLQADSEADRVAQALAVLRHLFVAALVP